MLVTSEPARTEKLAAVPRGTGVAIASAGVGTTATITAATVAASPVVSHPVKERHLAARGIFSFI
ncbi:hypothetical protein STENM327S_08221 [Streptomyces tendae]